jgi:hypothetical protein
MTDRCRTIQIGICLDHILWRWTNSCRLNELWKRVICVDWHANSFLTIREQHLQGLDSLWFIVSCDQRAMQPLPLWFECSLYRKIKFRLQSDPVYTNHICLTKRVSNWNQFVQNRLVDMNLSKLSTMLHDWHSTSISFNSFMVNSVICNMRIILDFKDLIID